MGIFGTVASFESISLNRDGTIAKGRERYSLDGVTATIEAGSAVEERITATRVLALGVFALAAKKKSGGESYLTIEGPEFVWTVPVDRKEQAKAREFVAKVMSAVKKAAAA